MQVSVFIERHNAFFDTMSQDDKVLYEQQKNMLNNYIIGLKEKTARDDFFMSDAASSLITLNPSDKQCSSYIKQIDCIIENEQYPEVSDKKQMVLSHMRNSPNIPDIAKEGVSFVLDKIDSYKGNDLKGYCHVIRLELDDFNNHQTKGFMDGALGVVKFFDDNYKPPMLNRGDATKFLHEQKGVDHVKEQLELYKCCDIVATIEFIKNEITQMNLGDDSSFVIGAMKELESFEERSKDEILAQAKMKESSLSM